MKLGITIGHSGETLADIARLAALAEDSGLTVIGIPDSQSIFRDTYCAMTAAALVTREIALITAITNVTTRHPVVTANAIATVDEASGGRALLGIGTGASSVSNLDLPRATAKELRQAIETINLAFDQASGTAEAGERAILLNWPESRVPIICGASVQAGLAMRVAAEQADGVMLIGSVDKALLTDRIADMLAIRAAGPRAGDPFQIWLYATGFVDDGPGAGRETVAGTVMSMAVTSVALKMEAYGVPVRLQPALRALKSQYDYKSHASPQGSLDALDRLGLSDWLFGQLTIGGSIEDVAAQLRALRDIGITGVILGGYVPDKIGLIRRIGGVCSIL